MKNTVAILASGEADPGEVVAATGTFGLIAALIAIPAAGAVILLLAGRRSDKWGHLLAHEAVIVDSSGGDPLDASQEGRS